MKFTKNGVSEEKLALEETLFTTSNGYLGVRGCLDEEYPEYIRSTRGAYVNGFYDDVKLSYPEKLFGFPETAQRLVNLPDIQTTRLSLYKENFSAFTGEILEHSRTLDVDKGLVKRFTRRKGCGGIVNLEITRMTSFVRKELFLTVYRVTSETYKGACSLISELNCDVSNYADPEDPRVSAESVRHIFVDVIAAQNDSSITACRTGKSNLNLAIVQKLESKIGAKKIMVDGQKIISVLNFNILPGESVEIYKYSVISDSRRQANPLIRVLKVLEEVIETGHEALFKEQEDYLREKFWKNSRFSLPSVPKIEEALSYNVFQLLQAAGTDGISSVSAKGLSGEGYEGHYFWDTEIYVFPFFLFTQPEIARCLLDYRHSILDGARAHAKIMGHKKGALYAWRTISGSECSSYFPSGSAQYHITGDVSYAFMQYFLVTGDIDYMEKKGAEVLLETARVWLEVGAYGDDGHFHIHSVTGPDEYTCIVDDNYYTNCVAKYNLESAVKIYKKLKETGKHKTLAASLSLDEAEINAFTKAAEAMFLPYDKELGIYAQDATFLKKPKWDLAATPENKFPLLLHYHPLYLYRHQVCKQADAILAHVLFPNAVKKEEARRAYEYYEKITTHDSSLSLCIFGIMANRLGEHETALKNFEAAALCDVEDRHKNTKDGFHIANLGGAWLGLVYGFAGLKIEENALRLNPYLPKKWKEYDFCITYMGTRLKFIISRENKNTVCKVEVLSGEKPNIFINDELI